MQTDFVSLARRRNPYIHTSHVEARDDTADRDVAFRDLSGKYDYLLLQCRCVCIYTIDLPPQPRSTCRLPFCSPRVSEQYVCFLLLRYCSFSTTIEHILSTSCPLLHLNDTIVTLCIETSTSKGRARSPYLHSPQATPLRPAQCTTRTKSPEN